ncbi:MAG: hypothetical protein ACQESP_04655 [Candidatus Muiribacteriota bacterium]
MISILSVGFDNLFQENRFLYEKISSFSDLSINVMVPKFISVEEMYKYVDDGKTRSYNIIPFEPVSKSEGSKKFLINSSIKTDFLLSAIEEIKPDIIEIKAEPYSKLAYDIIETVSYLKEMPKTVLFFKKNPDIFLFPKQYFLKKKVYSEVDFIVCPDELLKTLLLESGYKKNAYKVIHNPVNFNFHKREENSGKFVFGIESDKSYQNKLNILSVITDYSAQLKYLFFSGEKLSRTCLNKGFETSYMPGVSAKEKDKLISESDLFFFFKKFDFDDSSFKNNIIRAFINKIPVILPDEFPYNKIFKNYAFLFNELDESNLKKILINKEYRQKNMKNALDYAQTNYSSRQVCFKLFEIYKFLYKTKKNHFSGN